MIEMHRAWVNGLPPPPFSADNMEYLSSLPPVSHTQFPIFVDTPQHASGPAPGKHYPNTSNIYFLTPQHKATTCSAPSTVHVFAAPPPPKDTTFKVYPQVLPPHSPREPVLNIFADQHHAIEPTFKSTNPYVYTHLPEFPLNTETTAITEQQEKMIRNLRSLELAMKDLQGLGGGENEVNEVPSAHGNFGDDVGPLDRSYDDVGACEKSYTSQSGPIFGVRCNPFICKAYESYDESTREECEDSYSPPCSTSYQGQYSVNGYTSYRGDCPTRRTGYASPKPRDTCMLYNIDPRRSVLSRKVTIYGIPGCLIVLHDSYYRNYIMPSMVDYLELPCEPLLVPYSWMGSRLSRWDNHVLKASLKLDNELLKSELTYFKSAHRIDHALFRCNVFFEDDINTPNELSGENDGIACLGSYSRYANPLWCDNIPPNIFLKYESTLKGKECVVLLENQREKVSLTPWGNVSKCASLLDTFVLTLHEHRIEDSKLPICFEERMGMCLNSLSPSVYTFALGSFLYYLFAYDDIHASFGFIICRGKKLIGWSTCSNDYVMCVVAPLSMRSLEELYFKYVPPWHDDVYYCANSNPYAMRKLCLFVLSLVLQGMDSRSNLFQGGKDDTSQMDTLSFDSIFGGQHLKAQDLVTPRAQGYARKAHFEHDLKQSHVWKVVFLAIFLHFLGTFSMESEVTTSQPLGNDAIGDLMARIDALGRDFAQRMEDSHDALRRDMKGDMDTMRGDMIRIKVQDPKSPKEKPKKVPFKPLAESPNLVKKCVNLTFVILLVLLGFIRTKLLLGSKFGGWFPFFNDDDCEFGSLVKGHVGLTLCLLLPFDPGILLRYEDKPFIEVLKMGEMIEDGIKTGYIVSFATLKATTQAIQKGSESVRGKKYEEDASAIVVGQQARARGPNHHYLQAQTQAYAQAPQNHSQNLLYFIPPPPYPVYNAQPYVQSPSYPQWRAPTPQSYTQTLQTYRSASRPNF
ncbi:hypothetical protein FXO37_10617 [Capsicum annuum]|nr:hypothetical protein FXO37_10617 [Capsicum annuum]